jgi:hypothetical protein
MAAGHDRNEGLPERSPGAVPGPWWSPRTAAEWAEDIRLKLGKTVEGIVETGQLLTAAKADLGHGRFLLMFER